jgi:serine/threonine protein kinase
MPGVGDTFSGYRIERLLGRGGMGAVFLAAHERLRKQVALKILIPELAEDEEFRERFIRESMNAASIDHPNVIPIYDAGEYGGDLFITMRYVAGGDLNQQLRRRTRLSPAETVAIVEQVAGALDAAHAADLIHRDVKPANILIDEDGGRVYLSDFGIAKHTTTEGMTRTGGFRGTVHYCSPEQIHGQPLDGRADTYALGCVAFHCLAGQPPFPKDTEIAVAQAHLTEPVPALSTVRPELSPALDGPLATAMAKYPPVRYATSEQFAAALRDAVTFGAAAANPETLHDSAAGSTRPTVALSQATLLDAPYPTDPTRAAPPPTESRRGPGKGWLIAGGVAATLVLAGVLIALVALGGNSKSAAPPPTTTTTHRPPRKPDVSFTTEVAQRLRTQLVPVQGALTLDLRAVDPTRASLARVTGAASTVQQRVLETEGWLSSLATKTPQDRATMRTLNAALEAQATYATALAGLPSDPRLLTKPEAHAAYTDAGHAQDAYARLSGAAPSLPAMAIHRADTQRLLAIVPKPKPKVNPQPPPPAPVTTPVSADAVTQIEATIRSHWDAINSGDYTLAYDYFSSHLQSTQARDGWIQDKNIDQPTSSAISFGTVSVFGSSADAYVNFTTVGHETGPGNTGCNSWSGYYSMVDVSGTWYIDSSHLQRTSQPC